MHLLQFTTENYFVIMTGPWYKTVIYSIEKNMFCYKLTLLAVVKKNIVQTYHAYNCNDGLK